jgi:hypothetical protein
MQAQGPCRWRSKPASIRGRIPTRSLASVGGQRGLKRAVDAELMLLFPLVGVELTAGLGGA